MFFGLFKKEKKTSGPQYDSKLIKKFLLDHKELVKDIGNIQHAVETSDAKKAKQLLNQFKVKIVGHFMEEDIRLYWYLKKYYNDESSIISTVKMFEESIKGIQKDVIAFLEHYEREDVMFDADFHQKFKNIVSKLDARLQAEETSLYTLYIK